MKKAIVIGATSSIGKELARVLANNNYKVGITDKREDRLQELKEETPNAYFIQTLNLITTAVLVTKLEKLVAKMGGLDLVVISSETGHLAEKFGFNQEKQGIDTDVIGFTCVADWAFNQFLKQRYGHLIAISAGNGSREGKPVPAYSAIKAYQVDYLKSLQQKAKKIKQPIYVSDIRPGFVNAARTRDSFISRLLGFNSSILAALLILILQLLILDNRYLLHKKAAATCSGFFMQQVRTRKGLKRFHWALFFQPVIYFFDIFSSAQFRTRA